MKNWTWVKNSKIWLDDKKSYFAKFLISLWLAWENKTRFQTFRTFKSAMAVVEGVIFNGARLCVSTKQKFNFSRIFEQIVGQLLQENCGNLTSCCKKYLQVDNLARYLTFYLVSCWQSRHAKLARLIFYLHCPFNWNLIGQKVPVTSKQGLALRHREVKTHKLAKTGRSIKSASLLLESYQLNSVLDCWHTNQSSQFYTFNWTHHSLVVWPRSQWYERVFLLISACQ